MRTSQCDRDRFGARLREDEPAHSQGTSDRGRHICRSARDRRSYGTACSSHTTRVAAITSVSLRSRFVHGATPKRGTRAWSTQNCDELDSSIAGDRLFGVRLNKFLFFLFFFNLVFFDFVLFYVVLFFSFFFVFARVVDIVFFRFTFETLIIFVAAADTPAERTTIIKGDKSGHGVKTRRFQLSAWGESPGQGPDRVDSMATTKSGTDGDR